MDWPEVKDFGMSSEEEVLCPWEAPLCNELPERKEQYAFFIWVLAVLWESTRDRKQLESPQATETAEKKDELSQFAELKAIQLALDIAEWEKRLIHRQWQTPCGGGCRNGRRIIGSVGINPSGLLHCGKILLPRWRAWLWRYVTYPSVGPLKNIRTTSRWVRLPGLRSLRWTWSGNSRINYF